MSPEHLTRIIALSAALDQAAAAVNRCQDALAQRTARRS